MVGETTTSTTSTTTTAATTTTETGTSTSSIAPSQGAEAGKAVERARQLFGKTKARTFTRALDSFSSARLRTEAAVESLRERAVDLLEYAKQLDAEGDLETEIETGTEAETETETETTVAKTEMTTAAAVATAAATKMMGAKNARRTLRLAAKAVVATAAAANTLSSSVTEHASTITSMAAEKRAVAIAHLRTSTERLGEAADKARKLLIEAQVQVGTHMNEMRESDSVLAAILTDLGGLVTLARAWTWAWTGSVTTSADGVVAEIGGLEQEAEIESDAVPVQFSEKETKDSAAKNVQPLSATKKWREVEPDSLPESPNKVTLDKSFNVGALVEN